MAFLPKYIVIHHSVTARDASIQDIRSYHINRGMDDIACHFLIDEKGVVHNGRSVDVVGAHARGLNSQSLGVCCIGDFRYEAPPAPMITSLKNVVVRLQYEFSIPAINIIGHRDVVKINPEATRTECPGDALYSYLQYLREG